MCMKAHNNYTKSDPSIHSSVRPSLSLTQTESYQSFPLPQANCANFASVSIKCYFFSSVRYSSCSGNSSRCLSTAHSWRIFSTYILRQPATCIWIASLHVCFYVVMKERRGGRRWATQLLQVVSSERFPIKINLF